MEWREAFLAQARSDFRLFERLNGPDTEVCHWLHYLQMASEKLAKAYRYPAPEVEPEPVHGGLPTLLRIIVATETLREAVGLPHARSARRALYSLLPLAEAIDGLAPIRGGGPNAEYPWDGGTAGILAPCGHDFPDITVRNAGQLGVLTKYLRTLLQG